LLVVNDNGDAAAAVVGDILKWTIVNVKVASAFVASATSSSMYIYVCI
jgi:hypothetical protein